MQKKNFALSKSANTFSLCQSKAMLPVYLLINCNIVWDSHEIHWYGAHQVDIFTHGITLIIFALFTYPPYFTT